MISLKARRNNLSQQFAKNGITNGALLDLFPLNNKFHHMKTRQMEKYKIYTAKPKQLQSSSFISMQKSLNEFS